MPLFWKPYTSDVTAFIQTLKDAKPALEDEQRAGRALLWDRALDRTQLADWRQSRVRQQPYIYQTRPTNTPEASSTPGAAGTPAQPAQASSTPAQPSQAAGPSAPAAQAAGKPAA